ncbi:hypothetical protein [Methylobacterium sp. AMS5]|uniref:hypothetical protein n=1 Tax=Methylobacterium sp. AMS5 TaxID=925818 RepID=UPI00074FA71E|nr:hypothetical protein [Methylobacterium sp. AMS5]AMB46813.1 hypothetical protein Y590_17900 [Methylobacterium sp. AMS5]
MRRLAWGLLVLSLLAGGARLFTGVIDLSDEPTAALVLKRPEAHGRPVSEQIGLDREEPILA